LPRATTCSGNRPFRCKLCDAVGEGWNGAEERYVAQHVAMIYGVKDKDNIHKKWKEEHGITVKPQTMREVNQSISKILSSYKDDIVEKN
jgi:hypothetical protein